MGKTWKSQLERQLCCVSSEPVIEQSVTNIIEQYITNNVTEINNILGTGTDNYIAWVDKHAGDDATAVLGDITKPYATIQAANFDAYNTPSSDPYSVVVMPGNYNIGPFGDIPDDGMQYIAYPNVPIHFMEGATVTYLETDATLASIPFASDNGLYGKYSITGKGTFIFEQQGLGNEWSFITATASEFYWEFDTIETYKRLRFDGGKTFVFRGREYWNKAGQFITIRPSIAVNDALFIWETEITRGHENLNDTWDYFDIRSFNSGGIYFNIKSQIFALHFIDDGGFIRLRNMLSDVYVQLNYSIEKSEAVYRDYAIYEMNCSHQRNYNIQTVGALGGLRSIGLSGQNRFTPGIVNLNGTVDTDDIVDEYFKMNTCDGGCQCNINLKYLNMDTIVSIPVILNTTDNISLNIDVYMDVLTAYSNIVNLNGCDGIVLESYNHIVNETLQGGTPTTPTSFSMVSSIVNSLGTPLGSDISTFGVTPGTTWYGTILTQGMTL